MAASGSGAKARAAVIYNPTKVDIRKLRAAVSRAEAKAGWAESLWFETSEQDPGGDVTTLALEQGPDVVMAAGGDGTVRAIAGSLRGSAVPIGLLPSGTGNLLARNLNLRLDNLQESVMTALTGNQRRIDLGVIEAERADGTRDEHVFLVMAGIGLDAQLIAHTNPELKKRVGWLAYVEAGFRAVRGSTRMRIRYQLDDEPQRAMQAHTVLIGNCGSLQANIVLLPDARVDDGLLDIVALRPDGFVGWVQIWVKIVWENGVLRRSQVGRKIISMTREVRTLRYLKGKALVLRLERPEEFELDGDPFGEVIALRATVDPLGLAVRVPPQ